MEKTYSESSVRGYVSRIHRALLGFCEDPAALSHLLSKMSEDSAKHAKFAFLAYIRGDSALRDGVRSKIEQNIRNVKFRAFVQNNSTSMCTRLNARVFYLDLKSEYTTNIIKIQVYLVIRILIETKLAENKILASQGKDNSYTHGILWRDIQYGKQQCTLLSRPISRELHNLLRRYCFDPLGKQGPNTVVFWNTNNHKDGPQELTVHALWYNLAGAKKTGGLFGKAISQGIIPRCKLDITVFTHIRESVYPNFLWERNGERRTK